MEAPERDHNPDMELMKSRIESAGNIGTLKVSLVATLAVFNEHFTNIKARLAKLEKTVAANTKEEKRKSDKKKLNKNDIGGRLSVVCPPSGPQVGTFVHVAGMGMHEGEMRTIDNTEASTRDTLDPALTQFLAQAGLDPKFGKFPFFHQIFPRQEHERRGDSGGQAVRREAKPARSGQVRYLVIKVNYP